ncbi:MAG TPA: flagellar hook-length control protein FliK [Devosia sp.]|nr:flagellar hook-length control protein FliK [Devosia sp.]
MAQKAQEQATANLQALNTNPNASSQAAQGQQDSALAAAQSLLAQQEGSPQAGNRNSRDAHGTPGNPAGHVNGQSRADLAAQLQQRLALNADATQISGANATGANGPSAAADLPFIPTRQIVTLDEGDAPLSQLASAPLNGPQANLAGAVPRAAYQAPAVNLPQMAVQITRNFKQGNNRFDIRLDPAELGKVHVRLHVDDAGSISARLSVERPETLALLQRDARSLERMLAQSDLPGPRPNLEFSLQQNPFSGGHHSGEQAPADAPLPLIADNDPLAPPDDSTAVAAYRGTVNPAGISLWI